MCGKQRFHRPGVTEINPRNPLPRYRYNNFVIGAQGERFKLMRTAKRRRDRSTGVCGIKQYRKSPASGCCRIHTRRCL